MNTQGIETLKAVARRSLWLILLLVVLGIVLMNALRHSQGPEYQASAKVILSPVDLSQQFSGSSTYVDPSLIDQTESAIANAPGLFRRAAASAGGRLGSGGELSSVTDVSKDGTTITFGASDSDGERAVAIANIVAGTYQGWRADVAGGAIQKAINQVQNQLQTSGQTRADLVDQLNRLKVLKTLTSGNVLLVEPSRGATKTRPKPVRDTAIGALIGFFIAMILIAVREAVDTRVRSEEQVEEALDVPVIGTVETLPRRTTLVATGRRGERYGDMYALLAANLARESRTSPTLIAVTSATAGEGKTTTASNLAAALARRKADVLLVDLDTRKPMLGKVFDIPSGAPGLEQLLRRNLRPDSLMWTVSLNGSVASVARSGSLAAVEDPSENGHLGGSLHVLPLQTSIRGGIGAHLDRLRPVFTNLGKKHDFIVIDTPPALSLPDVTELSKFVDVVIVVVRHGRVTRRSLMALNRLHHGWPDVEKSAVLVGVPRRESYSYYEQ